MRTDRALLIVAAAVVITGLVFASAQRRPPQREPQPNAGHSASPEQNREVARRVFDDLFTQGRYGEIDQIYHGNCTVHFGGRTLGLAQAVEEGKGWRSAAPDLVMTADRISVNGDMVEVSWTARGTHTGTGHGLKPTGKRIMVRGTSRFHIENGKIIEAWNSEYRDELFRQLGVPRPVAFVYEKAQDVQARLSPLFSEFFSR